MMLNLSKSSYLDQLALKVKVIQANMERRKFNYNCPKAKCTFVE